MIQTVFDAKKLATILKCNLDQTSFHMKPKDNEFALIKPRVCNADKTIEITPEQLIEAIEQGTAFTPAALSGTKEDGWLSQQIIAVDIDNADKDKRCIENPLVPDEALALLREYGIEPYFMYWTFSRTENFPRYRIVFILERALETYQKARDITIRLISLFNAHTSRSCDSQCIDACRVFMGSFQNSVFYRSGKTLKAEDFERLPLANSSVEANTETTGIADKKHWLAENIHDILSYIGADDREQWYKVACALKHEGFPFELFDEWSKTSPHNYGGTEVLWNSLKRDSQDGNGRVITGGTLVKLARDSGWEYATETPFERRKGRPSTSEAKPELTIEALEGYLDSRGIDIRFDAILHDYSISGYESENKEHIHENLYALLHNELKQKYRGCSLQVIQSYCNVIASRREFNPVLDIINSVKLDTSVDMIQEVYSILGIRDDDTLSKMLIRKWLWQTVSILHNTIANPYSADSVLVLTGPQGCGKTSFFRKIAIENRFFKEGVVLDPRNKDAGLAATSSWICELGEIESTFKSDIAAIKAFISQQVDEIRRPYAKDASRTARRTSLCGTCNSECFLVDETGNRRYWTIPVKSIDLHRLNELDVKQLWKQVSALSDMDRQGFRLTKEELAVLNARNKEHEKPIRGQLECEEILSMPDSDIEWKYIDISTFKNEYPDILRNLTVEQIGRALTKLGVCAEMQKVNGVCRRMRKLPVLKR